MILLDMRGELPYRDGYTSRPFRTDSDDVLFGVPIITIYLPCIGKDHSITLVLFNDRYQKSIEFIEKNT